MPGPLLQTQDIANGAITSQPRKFGKANQGSARAARVFFYFKTANVPVGMPHSFGKTPSSWKPVSISRKGSVGAPGVVYAPTAYDVAALKTQTGHVYNLGRNYVVLACTTGNTWAEIELS